MLSSMGNGAVLPSTSVDAVLSSTGVGAVIFSTATARALFVLCQTTTVEKPLSLLFSFFLFFLSLTSSFSRALTTLHAAVIPLLLLCVLVFHCFSNENRRVSTPNRQNRIYGGD
ncbi:uncharacterized protein LOC110270983 isoform X2 [Arachis ipaensis]|uniref:uncharacterized protein LOC110270983 isoform X2 n=1 Tax=Arachis ipaensis TaxID=130454 RepID=UPI000A2B18F8|nr:uncharacterized protein LOC110270983 isoform X2 [Arachis ipaensis]